MIVEVFDIDKLQGKAIIAIGSTFCVDTDGGNMADCQIFGRMFLFFTFICKFTEYILSCMKLKHIHQNFPTYYPKYSFGYLPNLITNLAFSTKEHTYLLR